MEASEKECPACAESIKSKANVCRYCGYRFDGLNSDQLGSNHVSEAPKPGDTALRAADGCVNLWSMTIVVLILLTIVGGIMSLFGLGD